MIHHTDGPYLILRPGAQPWWNWTPPMRMRWKISVAVLLTLGWIILAWDVWYLVAVDSPAWAKWFVGITAMMTFPALVLNTVFYGRRAGWWDAVWCLTHPHWRARPGPVYVTWCDGSREGPLPLRYRGIRDGHWSWEAVTVPAGRQYRYTDIARLADHTEVRIRVSSEVSP